MLVFSSFGVLPKPRHTEILYGSVHLILIVQHGAWQISAMLFWLEGTIGYASFKEELEVNSCMLVLPLSNSHVDTSLKMST